MVALFHIIAFIVGSLVRTDRPITVTICVYAILAAFYCSIISQGLWRIGEAARLADPVFLLDRNEVSSDSVGRLGACLVRKSRLGRREVCLSRLNRSARYAWRMALRV